MGYACHAGVHEEPCAGYCGVYAAVSKEWASKGGKHSSNYEEQGELEKQGKPQGRDGGYKP